MRSLDPDPPIGAVLRQLRQARGFTIEEAAERGRMAANYLGEVERGNRNPTLKVVARLLAALRITWSEFGAAIDSGSNDAGETS
jgi:transcriptional regulator with XRE-family HTH domain